MNYSLAENRVINLTIGCLETRPNLAVKHCSKLFLRNISGERGLFRREIASVPF